MRKTKNLSGYWKILYYIQRDLKPLELQQVYSPAEYYSVNQVEQVLNLAYGPKLTLSVKFGPKF